MDPQPSNSTTLNSCLPQSSIFSLASTQSLPVFSRADTVLSDFDFTHIRRSKDSYIHHDFDSSFRDSSLKINRGSCNCNAHSTLSWRKNNCNLATFCYPQPICHSSYYGHRRTGIHRSDSKNTLFCSAHPYPRFHDFPTAYPNYKSDECFSRYNTNDEKYKYNYGNKKYYLHNPNEDSQQNHKNQFTFSNFPDRDSRIESLLRCCAEALLRQPLDVSLMKKSEAHDNSEIKKGNCSTKKKSSTAKEKQRTDDLFELDECIQSDEKNKTGIAVHDDVTRPLADNDNSRELSHRAHDGDGHFREVAFLKLLVDSLTYNALDTNRLRLIANQSTIALSDEKIKFLKSPQESYFPGTSLNILAISSTSIECLVQAIDLIAQLSFVVTSCSLEQKESYHRRCLKLAVPRSIAGSLIGKSGEEIKQLRYDLGVNIHISPLFVPSEAACSERIVVLTSKDKSTLRKALRTLAIRINHHPEKAHHRSVVYRKTESKLNAYHTPLLRSPTSVTYKGNEWGCQQYQSSTETLRCHQDQHQLLWTTQRRTDRLSSRLGIDVVENIARQKNTNPFDLKLKENSLEKLSKGNASLLSLHSINLKLKMYHETMKGIWNYCFILAMVFGQSIAHCLHYSVQHSHKLVDHITTTCTAYHYNSYLGVQIDLVLRLAPLVLILFYTPIVLLGFCTSTMIIVEMCILYSKQKN